MNKKYPIDSAGSIMIQDVPMINYDQTIGDVEDMLFRKASDVLTINYIHVIDSAKHLVGIFSIREIFLSHKKTAISKICHKKIISVLPETDKEQVVMLALKNNLKSIPVVDKNNVFLGVIPNNLIIKTLYEEMTEDIMHMSGFSQEGPYGDAETSLPITNTLKRRLPWLIIGMMGGVLAAGVVGIFEEMLSKYIILAAFIPLIVYMSGASCSQMQAFIIRDLAFNPKLKFIHYLFKQSGITILMGLSTSIILYVISLLLYGEPMISFVLSIALLFAITSSLLAGTIIPFIFARLKLDPADASGPIGTIIQDTISVSIYLIVASWLLL
ncbi:MAG: magnesium transporter [Candidatus Pacebacteria bacterium]|nr:magnesium transporter [Candidatus Paceibacterota bacterium]MDD4738103.1 magnesium transporter [Candidatus Paceibacterota bacterium]